MSDVQFEEEQGLGMPAGSHFEIQTNPPLVSFVVHTGIARDPRQANYFLIGFAILASAVALFIFNTTGTQPPTPEEIAKDPQARAEILYTE